MSGSDIPIIRIAPSQGWVSLKLHDLWEYRELLYFLAWRDIKVRYKQTVLGAAWAIIQPLTTMIIFTIIFGQLAKIPSDGIPYPIFSFCALLGKSEGPGPMLAISMLVTVIILVSGAYYFRRMEKTFADVV